MKTQHPARMKGPRYRLIGVCEGNELKLVTTPLEGTLSNIFQSCLRQWAVVKKSGSTNFYLVDLLSAFSMARINKRHIAIDEVAHVEFANLTTARVTIALGVRPDGP